MKRGLVNDKTGQFYLVAAIIISVIIIGLVTFSNYSTSQESTSIQNVGEELKIESGKVLDFGTYNGYDDAQMQDLMEDFTSKYITYVQNGGDYYFLFGNSDKITVVGYSKTIGTIDVDTGFEKTSIDIPAAEITSQEFNTPSDNIIITVNGTDYLFELKKGENFYFIVSQSIGGETHVTRN